MLTICFVCSGNTCRSIMAERLLKKMVKGKMNNVKIISRGLFANGENITENAKVVLKENKALASDRKSMKLKKIDKKTLYVAMTDKIKSQIDGKVISFRDLLGKDISDPYMQSIEVYRQTAKEIIEGLKILVEKILKVRSEK